MRAQDRDAAEATGRSAGGEAPAPGWRGRLRAVWNWVVGAVGFVMGLLPHVLHHVGVLAGTALVAGTGGTLLFGALGLAASVPMLVRLHRRFGTWAAPAIGVAVFAAMFALSAFVIGPAISGSGGAGTGPSPEPTPMPSEHHTAGH